MRGLILSQNEHRAQLSHDAYIPSQLSVVMHDPISRSLLLELCLPSPLYLIHQPCA